ncbi:MAG: 30S ribosomal protein S20 [Desulfurivibrionaceae bacterium]
MANHKSALKRARQNEVRNSRNRANKSKIKTVVRRVNEAIDSKAPEEAEKALQEAIPVIQKAATKGTLHKKTASRKVSRLTRRINKFKEVQEATS